MLSESCKLVLNLTNHTPREKDTVIPDLETDEEGKEGKKRAEVGCDEQEAGRNKCDNRVRMLQERS